MSKSRLTIGVTVKQAQIAAWQFEALRQIDDLVFVNIVSLRITGTADSSNNTLLNWLQQQDRHSPSPNDDALSPRSVADALPSAVFDDAIRTDIQLDLAGDEHPDDNTNEVWSFAHNFGECDSGPGCDIGFFAVTRRLPFIVSALRIRRVGEPEILTNIYRNGVRHTTWCRSRNEHLWSIAPLMAQTLRDRHAVEALKAADDVPESLAANVGRISTAQRLIALASYLRWRLTMKVRRRRWTERWVLLLANSSAADDMASFERLMPPPDTMWADPFIAQRDGETALFFEAAPTATLFGHIAAGTLDGDGTLRDVRPVLQRDYHLSYPFVFEYDGELLMIPESAANQTIDLYRCTEFPYRWQHVRTLMSGISAYDSTLLQHNGRWWLFASVQSHPHTSCWSELSIYYADTPTGDAWQAHPLNPVVRDVRRARPAGRIFSRGDKLLRPSQDSSHRYGYALNLNEITQLTTTTYSERLVRHISPDWQSDVRAVHTYNSVAGVTVSDAIVRSRRDA